MNITKITTNFLAAAILLGALFAVATPSPALAAELTTWQKFIQKKCSGSADAAERCAENLTTKLKDKCGAPKDTDKYINCWRTFIKSNGGTAGPNSSPFEEEVPGGTISEGCASLEEHGGTSIIKCDVDGGNPVMSIVIQVINFLAVGVGIAVVGGIAWGGIVYASSNGDPGKTKQAITIIVNAVVGLLLFIFMYAFINFLVPGGLFN